MDSYFYHLFHAHADGFCLNKCGFRIRSFVPRARGRIDHKCGIRTYAVICSTRTRTLHQELNLALETTHLFHAHADASQSLNLDSARTTLVPRARGRFNTFRFFGRKNVTCSTRTRTLRLTFCKFAEGSNLFHAHADASGNRIGHLKKGNRRTRTLCEYCNLLQKTSFLLTLIRN